MKRLTKPNLFLSKILKKHQPSVCLNIGHLFLIFSSILWILSPIFHIDTVRGGRRDWLDSVSDNGESWNTNWKVFFGFEAKFLKLSSVDFFKPLPVFDATMVWYHFLVYLSKRWISELPGHVSLLIRFITTFRFCVRTLPVLLPSHALFPFGSEIFMTLSCFRRNASWFSPLKYDASTDFQKSILFRL